MSNSNCQCGGCGCSVCQPANVIYQRPCTDPGVINVGANLLVSDSNFCNRRLAPSEGFVVINLVPGGYQVSSTTEPNVNLSTFAVASGAAIGNILVRNTDGIIRTLAPAAVANLILMTNAAGQFVLSALPPFSVPDPLSVTTLNATSATFGSLTVTGPTAKFTGLVTGTIASTVGLDASGNLVLGTPAATGVQTAMFYESASSPGATTPNQTITAGSMLVIGNQLYDSGASLLSVVNTQKLKVNVAGKYTIEFCCQVGYTGGGTGTPALNLVINGITVNTGNARGGITSTTDRTAFIFGVDARDLAINDTVELQLSSTAGGAGNRVHVYEARLVAQKFQ